MLQGITFEDLHEVVDALTSALDAKNPYTCGHSERVAEIALILSRRMGLPLLEQCRIHMGAHLHDIGKIGISDAILNKPGKLTEDEFAQVRRHPEIGSRIVGKISLFGGIADIARYHHERYDGLGYPEQLDKENIPLGARIVSVADCFEAMTGKRPYRAALGFREALTEMVRCRGTQFDPVPVDALLEAAQSGELDFCIAQKVG